MSEPQNASDATSATETSAEVRQADTGELSGRSRPVPPTWWSPSGREWFSTDDETGLYSVGEFVSPAESLPSDAVRLVPAGPLLELVERWMGVRDEFRAVGQSLLAEVSERHADRLREVLASLLGETPTTAQEGTDG